ncbi:NYN domain-containing protein [Variovorax sp. RHLX14]|uniref:NYN domain-containing protein n=1 Tax=Variovorax sp. RHLX14 TaxID=1259731 RepID=UPI003F46FEE9
MNNDAKVMLLIDADNVSVDVMEQAMHRVLAAHGHLHVRRAYGTPEVALRHQALFKRLSIRPMVNLAAGKNSTDIALAVDAMDLAISERPQVIYLVSSDSDFAPLVLRLREKGCRVCGIGQQGKTGEETTIAYDDFIDLRHNSARDESVQASVPAAKPARKSAAKTPSTRTPAAKKAKPVAEPAAKKAPAKAARKKAAPAKSAASEAAEFILQAVPSLRNGGEIELKDVAQALRAAKLLGKHASSIKLFEKLPAEFAVMQHPDRIRWIGAGEA